MEDLDRENEDLSRYPATSPNAIKAANGRVLSPSPSYNKWDCFSWRNRNKVAVCAQVVLTPPDLNKLNMMDSALKVNHLFNIENNPSDCKTQVGRIPGSSLPGTDSGCRKLTLREKLAKQKLERDVSNKTEIAPSSKDDVPTVETQSVKRSTTLYKSESLDVRGSKPSTVPHTAVVRSSSSNAITEDKTIFGYKIMKGALRSSTGIASSRQSNQRTSAFVRSGSLRKPRVGEESDMTFFYSPKTVDSGKETSLGKSKQDIDQGRRNSKQTASNYVSSAKDKVGENVDVKEKEIAQQEIAPDGEENRSKNMEKSSKTMVASNYVSSAEHKVDEIVEVREKEIVPVVESSRDKSKQDGEEGRSKNMEKSSKTMDSTDVSSAKDKVGEIVEVRDQEIAPVVEGSRGKSKQDAEEDRSNEMEETCKTLVSCDVSSAEDKVGEIVDVSRERRARKLLSRTESLEEGKSRLQDFRARQRRGKLTRSLTNPDPHEQDDEASSSLSKSKNISESLADIRERIRERRRKNELKRSHTCMPPDSDASLQKESAGKADHVDPEPLTSSEPLSTEAAKKEETENGVTLNEKDGLNLSPVKEEDLHNETKPDSFCKIKCNVVSTFSSEEENTREDKDVTLNEKEGLTVSPVKKEDLHNDNKPDSSGKLESNVASTFLSEEENTREDKRVTLNEKDGLTVSIVKQEDLHNEIKPDSSGKLESNIASMIHSEEDNTKDNKGVTLNEKGLTVSLVKQEDLHDETKLESNIVTMFPSEEEKMKENKDVTLNEKEGFTVSPVKQEELHNETKPDSSDKLESNIATMFPSEEEKMKDNKGVTLNEKEVFTVSPVKQEDLHNETKPDSSDTLESNIATMFPSEEEKMKDNKGVTLNEEEVLTVSPVKQEDLHNETKPDSSDKLESNIATMFPSEEEKMKDNKGVTLNEKEVLTVSPVKQEDLHNETKPDSSDKLESNIATMFPSEEEKMKDNKGVTLNEKEILTVSPVKQEDLHNETKPDSSGKLKLMNVPSLLFPSEEPNKDTGSVKAKPAESTKQTRRERRRLDRYQRSKTMSAIMYSDICLSASRDTAHKDDGVDSEKGEQPLAVMPSVSEMKKRFLEDNGANSKMSEPGLFYSQKVLPPRKFQSSRKTKTMEKSEKVTIKPESLLPQKAEPSSSQDKTNPPPEPNSRRNTLARRHTLDINVYIENDVTSNETTVLDNHDDSVPRSPEVKEKEWPSLTRGRLPKRRHTFHDNSSINTSDQSPLKETVENRSGRFAAKGGVPEHLKEPIRSQENKLEDESSLSEQSRRRIKSDGEAGGARIKTEIYVQVQGNGSSNGHSLTRRHTIDVQPTSTGERQVSEKAKQERRMFFEKFLTKSHEVPKEELVHMVENKETSGAVEGSVSRRLPGKEEPSRTRASKKDEERKKKKEEDGKTTSVSKLRKLFQIGRPASAEKKSKLRERRAKTIAEGISPEILNEINSRNKPDLIYLAESTREKAVEQKSLESSQRSDKAEKPSIPKILCSPPAKDLNPDRYLFDERSPEFAISTRSDETGVDSVFDEEKTPKSKQSKRRNRSNSVDGVNPRSSQSDSSRDAKFNVGHSEPAVKNSDSGIPIADQCLDDYLTTIKSLADSPKSQRNVSESPRGSHKKSKFKGAELLNRGTSSSESDDSRNATLAVHGPRVDPAASNLAHSWSTSDLDKVFYGNGETSKVPHVSSEMELSSVDFDEISDRTTRLQSLTEGRTKTRPKKTRSKSLNPLKSLQERTDVRTNTEEPEDETKATTGFEKPKKRSTPRKKRSQLEPWRRHTLDPVALAALASREDFSRVSLRRTKGPGKDNDEFNGSLPVMLIQIKGRRQVQTRLVEPKQSSLNSGDCFILVTPKELFCWIGHDANTIEKAKAVEISSKIQKRGDFSCKTGDVLYIDEGKQDNSLANRKFCKILEGDTSSPIEDAEMCPDDEFYEREVISTNMIYKVQEGDPPRLVPVNELCGHMPCVAVLNTKEVFIFDFGSEVYLWTGQQSLSGKRKVAFHLAQMLYQQQFNADADVTPIEPNRISKRLTSADETYHDGEGKECARPAWTLFARLHEKAETLLFREKFFDWPDPTKIIKMKGHVSSGEVLERALPIVLKPCDVTEMQKLAIPLEPIVLECTNLGRGLGTPNVEVDGVVKEGDLVTTLGMTVWLVTQNKHFVLPKNSEGHFHSGDGYVIRWVYFVAKNRVVKDKRGRIRQLTGRQRCAYFFWQGNACSVNEKGAAAIMAVELDEERGPQIRVVEGKEPPHFLRLFNGAMVIHTGKRVRLQDGQDDFSDKSAVRMFCVRNEDSSEGSLVQVGKSSSSLRSRSSFVVVDCEAGHIYVWHGCKANEYHRKTAETAANYMKDRKPNEVHLSEEKSVVLMEIEEGQEPESFWRIVGGKKCGYMSLIKDRLNYDFSPRLFYLTSSTGVFAATEILFSCRYPGRTCPFPVTQEDLYFACQPAMFILDVGDELYVWEGWMPSEIANDKKGSGKRRWDSERKLSLETAMSYVKEANNRLKKGAHLVQAGLEPLSFISHFPYWERRQHVADINIKEGKKDCEKRPVKDVLDSLTQKYYSFQELTGDSPPDGVDLSKLEIYLREEEFEKVFEMSRELFNQLPGWKQDVLKKAFGLF